LNRLQLFKTLAPGFLPLIVFIAADSIWGSRVGLVVAVISGLVELAVAYMREKLLDRFVLLDTGLIVVLGSVSLLLKTDIFFRLKPALLELIFCVILGISVYSPVNIMLLMSRRYLKRIALTREQMQPLLRGMKTMFFVFLGHTLLIVYAALAMSVRAWGFISGGLFYLLFAVYFLLEWGRNRLLSRRKSELAADGECFDIVDTEGKVLGNAPRSLCHSRPGFLHQVIHLHVVNSEGQIFLQKRSLTKHIQPGKWDTAVGGHVQSGENIQSALKREADEELGLSGFKAQALARYLWESDVESELVHMFVTRAEGPMRLNRLEMDEGEFWKLEKIRAVLGKGILTANFEFEFPILLGRFMKES
jgi:isopentenyldiphosphate isomerase/intracellular septation protein A